MTWVRRRRGVGGDEGQAVIPILLTAIIAILAVTMLLLQVGRAGLLSTRTQTAADAAALAAADEARDHWMALLAEGVLPWELSIGADVLRSAAARYADRNGAELTHFDSFSGLGQYVVTVKTRSEEAQGGELEKVKDRHAKAKATAVLTFPNCYKTPVYAEDENEPPTIVVSCDGERVESWTQGAPLADRDLTDEIGPMLEPHLVAEKPDPSSLYQYPELPGAKGGPITRAMVKQRALSWIRVGGVPYSMRDYYRGYRTDCSGFVSMAWGLERSLTTETLPGVSHPIDKDDLQTGDILLRQNGADIGHVIIFLRWVPGSNHTKYYAVHQTGPETTKEVITMDGGYLAYRYDNITEKGGASKPA